MAESQSTRLRSISAKTLQEVEATVEALPFKVEIKAIQPDKTGWVASFVIPDPQEFISVDLREI